MITDQQKSEVRRAVLSCLVTYNKPRNLTAIHQHTIGYCRDTVPNVKRWDVQLTLDDLIGRGIVGIQHKGKTAQYHLV